MTILIKNNTMKNFYYLFVALLIFSCSDSDEAEPDSVKKYLTSNIFKESGSYTVFNNNTVFNLGIIKVCGKAISKHLSF